MHIGILIFPAVTQLDATGPAQVLARTPGATLHMIWKTRDPVKTDAGFSIVPTTTLADCPQLDVICIPGGAGQIDLMNDAETLAFVAAQGAKARYVTSVCTGSLVLGAAGVLEGKRATSHWAYRDELTQFGATPVAERWVEDGKIVTAAGVSAGIDMALHLVSRMFDENVAKAVQLGVEYDPDPPFDAGSPEKAGPELTEFIRNLEKAGAEA